jgi:hypothetical protein
MILKPVNDEVFEHRNYRRYAFNGEALIQNRRFIDNFRFLYTVKTAIWRAMKWMQ